MILGAFLYVLMWSKNDVNLCKMLWVGYTVGYTVGYKITGSKPDYLRGFNSVFVGVRTMVQNAEWLKYGVFIPFAKFYTFKSLKSL